jgi:hypothetical protein
MKISRRNNLAGGSTAVVAMVGLVRSSWAQLFEAPRSPDLIVHNARVTTRKIAGRRRKPSRFAVKGLSRSVAMPTSWTCAPRIRAVH